MSIDADFYIKLAKESRAFGTTPLGVRCHVCGAPALDFGEDLNGERIKENWCGGCMTRAVSAARARYSSERTPEPAADPATAVCKYCSAFPPLLGVWCGPCAIRFNENLLSAPYATNEEKAGAAKTLAYIKSLCPESPPDTRES